MYLLFLFATTLLPYKALLILVKVRLCCWSYFCGYVTTRIRSKEYSCWVNCRCRLVFLQYWWAERNLKSISIDSFIKMSLLKACISTNYFSVRNTPQLSDDHNLETLGYDSIACVICDLHLWTLKIHYLILTPFIFVIWMHVLFLN